MLRVTVKDGERALLTRNGRLERVLEPGRPRMFDPARPDLASSLFEAVETKAGELAVVSYDGRPVHLVGPWATRVFWKVATRIDVERIDVAVDPKVAPRHLKMVARERNTHLTEVVIENHEAGLRRK